jgi:polysaccharide export outer membrane protein
VQLVALAGGFLEYARADAVIVLREEPSRMVAIKFNYDEVTRGRRLEQNVQLYPGDTVIVP